MKSSRLEGSPGYIGQKACQADQAELAMANGPERACHSHQATATNVRLHHPRPPTYRCRCCSCLPWLCTHSCGDEANKPRTGTLMCFMHSAGTRSRCHEVAPWSAYLGPLKHSQNMARLQAGCAQRLRWQRRLSRLINFNGGSVHAEHSKVFILCSKECPADTCSTST